jgi:hypothetical protein
VQVLRPHLAVIIVELEDLDEDVMRHDSDLVMPGPCTDRSHRFIPTLITTTRGVAYAFKTISPMTSS